MLILLSPWRRGSDDYLEYENVEILMKFNTFLIITTILILFWPRDCIS